MMIGIYLILFLVIAFLAVTNLPVFGKLPKGTRLSKIKALPNYREGAIHNESVTPMQPEGVSFYTILWSFLFEKHPDKSPKRPIKPVQPDFSFNGVQPEIIWFGHSSYLIKIDGLYVLVDPVFSRTPSPFSFIGSKAFAGTDFLKAEDLPDLDVVLITHDHYDHLDYATIKKLKPKTKLFMTSLGVGAHLEHWGIAEEKIKELSWNQSSTAINGLTFTALPARHFTGRKFKRNQTLWSSFILETASCKLYLGGDSGYDVHFEKIGAQFGPFDLVLLECGQYNAYWPYIHMFPEQTVQAAIDLKAKVLMPVHWGKFTLAMHPWYEPISRAVKYAALKDLKITTPKLGEKVILNTHYPSVHWWNEII